MSALYLAGAIVSAVVLIYLMVALLAPERFQ